MNEQQKRDWAVVNIALEVQRFVQQAKDVVEADGRLIAIARGARNEPMHFMFGDDTDTAHRAGEVMEKITNYAQDGGLTPIEMVSAVRHGAEDEDMLQAIRHRLESDDTFYPFTGAVENTPPAGDDGSPSMLAEMQQEPEPENIEQPKPKRVVFLDTLNNAVGDSIRLVITDDQSPGIGPCKLRAEGVKGPFKGGSAPYEITQDMLDLSEQELRSMAYVAADMLRQKVSRTAADHAKAAT